MPAPLYCPQLSPRITMVGPYCTAPWPIVKQHGGHPFVQHHALLYSSIRPETGQIGDAQIENSLPGLRLNHIHLSTTNVPMHDVSTQCFNALDVSTSCFLLSLHLSSLDTLLANLHILEFSCTNTLVSAASCAVLFSALWKFDSGDPMMHHTCTIGFVEYMLQCSEAAYQSGLDDGSMVITTHISMCIRQSIAMATDAYEAWGNI